MGGAVRSNATHSTHTRRLSPYAAVAYLHCTAPAPGRGSSGLEEPSRALCMRAQPRMLTM